MSKSKLISLSGTVLVLAGVLIILYGMLDMFLYPNLPSWMPLVAVGSFLAFQFGLVGLYARQVETSGLVGLLGFVTTFTGASLYAGLALFESFTPSVQVESAPDQAYVAAAAVFAAGTILLGLSSITEKAIPLWPSLLLALSAVMIALAVVRFGSAPPLVSPPWGAWLLGISQIWFGLILRGQPTPAGDSHI